MDWSETRTGGWTDSGEQLLHSGRSDQIMQTIKKEFIEGNARDPLGFFNPRVNSSLLVPNMLPNWVQASPIVPESVPAEVPRTHEPALPSAELTALQDPLSSSPSEAESGQPADTLAVVLLPTAAPPYSERLCVQTPQCGESHNREPHPEPQEKENIRDLCRIS